MFFLEKIFRNKSHDIKADKLPKHIAIIMDGNGRWAKSKGLPRNFGHREGSNNLRRIVHYCADIGIKHLTVYAFSTENWKRPQSEVETLMNLLLEYLKNSEKELEGRNARIRVIGNTEGLPGEIRNEITRVEKMTKKNTGMEFIIALNYGGRDELINAFRSVARDVSEKRLPVDSINEEEVSRRLYTSGIPDPDLLIRTSGEKRISNFLLWQNAYAELYFSEVMWPDFTIKRLNEAIYEYQKRNRRYGGI